MQSVYLKLDNVSLAVLDVCPHYEEGYVITRINVPRKHRGKGIASYLLKQCCKQADKENVNLYLEILSSDGLTKDQLLQWYKRYGFRDRFGIMKRVFQRSTND